MIKSNLWKSVRSFIERKTSSSNLWATETMGNAKYPLELFQRVITVSLETMKIVEGLPELDIDETLN